jgi:phosphatidylethanolamine N-methyltransferase
MLPLFSHSFNAYTDPHLLPPFCSSSDFVAYCMFAFACFRIPTDLSMTLHVLRWLGGLALIGFNLWVKTEAHGVVKDYGWYWGESLPVTADRCAQTDDRCRRCILPTWCPGLRWCIRARTAPNVLRRFVSFYPGPNAVNSVKLTLKCYKGYAGYYGLSLIVGSYPVLFVSLAAHAAQFAFLVFFENPRKCLVRLCVFLGIILIWSLDIERAYGQRKLLAQRTPLTTYAHSHPRGKSSGTTTPVTSSRSRTDSKKSLGSGTGTGTGTGTSSFDQLESLNSLGRLDDVDAFASLEGLAPSETEGETAIESDNLDNDTETETELELEVEVGSGVATTGTTGRIMEAPAVSTSSINAIIPPSTSGSAKHTHNSKRERTSRPSMSTSMSTPMLSQHDIMNYYFHKDTIALHNFDILR